MDANSTPRTQQQFLDAVVKELNLDTTDTFTKLLANAFALADQRDHLKRELSVALDRVRELEKEAAAALSDPTFVPVDSNILIQDMAMLIRRLCRKIDIYTEDDLNGILKSAAAQAIDFLKRKGLQGSPLREDATAPAAKPAEDDHDK